IETQMAEDKRRDEERKKTEEERAIPGGGTFVIVVRHNLHFGGRGLSGRASGSLKQ
ncbi:hypothetical protein E4U38_000268, partial [Claviceps purpurea]